MISTEDLHWMAGLLEGEGYFGHRRHGDIIIQVSMTDGDVIERLKTITGFGTLRQRQLPSGKDLYLWTSTHQANTGALMTMLLPLMGKRRQAKIAECLERWKEKRPWKLGATCQKGHPLSGDNLIIAYEGKYKKRRCKECIKLRMRKHRAKKLVAAASTAEIEAELSRRRSQE